MENHLFLIKTEVFKRYVLFILLIVFSLTAGHGNEDIQPEQAVGKVSGVVYHDMTGSGTFEPGKDKPLAGVGVSNGREVSVTDANGAYTLPLRDNSVIFVIKPANWMVPVDELQLPRFYHFYSASGASGNDFEGLPPSGTIPESLDFPLYPSEEPDKFDVIVFGDTQARDEKEVFHIFHDALPELAGTGAAFGVTLGDVVFDDLDLYRQLTGGIATIGIPWRYILGNHDIDFSANNDWDARGAFFRNFGPSWYSFAYGQAHFIILDNIRWIVEGESRYYRTGLGGDQMEFLRNELERTGRERLIVLLTHIPWAGSTDWYDEQERNELFEMLSGYPNSFSLVAHMHRHYHHFLGSEDGYPGSTPHHMISVGAVCGAWWTGAPDEYGIPHAMMSDGTPTSHAILHIEGESWKMSWKASRRPESFQMHIDAPDMVSVPESPGISISANIFNALPDAEVVMKIGDSGDWIRMERRRVPDPVRLAVAEREGALGIVPWRNLGNPVVSEHLWVAEPGITIAPGVHLIHVRAVDDWHTYEGRRLIYVR